MSFADPVHDAQRIFRALLDAMARPGRFVPLPLVPPNVPLAPAMAAAALALLDADTAVWVQPEASDDVRRWVRARCAARLCDDPASADFAIVVAPSMMPPLDAFALGSDLDPESSTTVLLDVGVTLSAAGVTLRGPGIATTATLRAALPAAFWERRSAQHAAYPRGVDLLLFAGDRVAGLPRTAEAVQ